MSAGMREYMAEAHALAKEVSRSKDELRLAEEDAVDLANVIRWHHALLGNAGAGEDELRDVVHMGHAALTAHAARLEGKQ